MYVPVSCQTLNMLSIRRFGATKFWSFIKYISTNQNKVKLLHNTIIKFHILGSIVETYLSSIAKGNEIKAISKKEK